MAQESPPTAHISPTYGRRAFLLAGGTLGVTWLAGCLSEPSSGGPSYRAVESDDGPIFAPGLQDEIERDYYAALVVTEADAGNFDVDRLSETGAAFVTETDFEESYLGLIQVSALNSSMRFEVVDIHESDVSLTVNVAIRDDPPYSEDRVVSSLLLRVARDGGTPPDRIAVELGIGDHHETFSGTRI